MNFDFAEQINPELECLEFEKAITITENELRKIQPTDFHDVLDKSLVGQAEELTLWIEDFHSRATAKSKVSALYFEINEFDINTELWYIDGFAYRIDGGLDLDNMEWLCGFDTDSQTETNTVFKIIGYEKLQSAFESTELTTSDVQSARDWCEQIIISRFMQLMQTAHLRAKAKNLKWSKMPIYFTVHSYDFVVKSNN